MDSKEDKPERPASDPAEAALEKQRELLAAATARLRARIDKAPPWETGPGADEQAGAASAGPAAGESEEPPPAGREPSSAPPEEVADGATVEMIVERAHRLVRVSREAKRASPRQPVPPPASTPPAPATDDAPTHPAPDGEDEAPAGDAAERAPAEPAAAKAAPAAEPPAAETPNAKPPAAPAPKPPHRSSPPWLPRALRAMAAREPADAGRLFLSLLPAHGLVESRDLRYDLVLGDTGCLAVDLIAGRVTISEQLTPRPAGQVDFQVDTSLAGLGVALAGGRMRRLMTRERVRVTPDGRRLDTLRLLAQAPLGLQALHSVGVRLDPMLAYRALTASIEPQWTAGHHFTLLHEVAGSPAHRCCVHVDGERPVAVVSPVPRQFNATVLVRCPPERFLPLLGGELTRAEEQELVQGEVDPLTALQDWIARIEWSGAYGG